MKELWRVRAAGESAMWVTALSLLVARRARPRHRLCCPGDSDHPRHTLLLLLLLLALQRLHVDDEVQVGKLVCVVPSCVEGCHEDFVLKQGN